MFIHVHPFFLDFPLIFSMLHPRPTDIQMSAAQRCLGDSGRRTQKSSAGPRRLDWLQELFTDLAVVALQGPEKIQYVEKGWSRFLVGCCCSLFDPFWAKYIKVLIKYLKSTSKSIWLKACCLISWIFMVPRGQFEYKDDWLRGARRGEPMADDLTRESREVWWMKPRVN